MEEDEGSLSKNNEESVDHLEQLRGHEHEYEVAIGALHKVPRIAHSICKYACLCL